MSVLKTFNIALDTKQELYVAPFTLYEGDTGNRFVITLTDDGTPVDLSGCRVSVVFSGAMGTAMQDSWTGTGDVSISGTSHNIITADIHNGAFANGLNTCQIEVYSGVDYGTLITTAFFTFTGEKPILDDDTIQAAEAYPTLVYWAGVVEGLTTREQSDWTQTDDTQGNFIQHKPVVGTDIQAATQNLTAETTLADADTVPFYDASATAHRKSTWANIVSTIRTLFFGASSGLLKANGSGVISAATENTDYAAGSHKTRHATGGGDALVITDIASAGVDYADPTLIGMTGNYGVFTGGAVTAQGSPNQTVAVSAGSIITPEGKRYAFDAVASLAATAADATNPRIDIVYATSAGVVTYLAGTAAASPAQPSTPSNGTILAAITRAANDNTIATSDISDRRDFISTSSDFEDVTSVTEASNEFYCDFGKKHTKNFSFSITNTTGKTVFFNNVPYGTCDTILTIKATGTATVAWTLDSRTLVWPAGAPVLTTGYTYEILFSYIPLLGKWVGRAQLGAAN